MIKLKEKINILVTLDENYLAPLEVMLISLHVNNPGVCFDIWLLHERISDEKIIELENFIEFFDSKLFVQKVDGSLLKDSPSIHKYPKEMYFRLMCGQLLPDSVERVIYLDPDTLIINPIQELWNLDITDYMMAAATHAGLTNISNVVNNIRLNTDHVYFNSGVMLIDTHAARENIHLTDIYEVVEKYKEQLILPDQDVLNHLYGNYIKEIPEEIWNYDTRQMLVYYTRSKGIYDTKWLLENTAILHFCGKPKPWKQKNLDKLATLYMHYQQLTKRVKNNL